MGFWIDLSKVFEWVGVLVCIGIPVLVLCVLFMYFVGKNAEFK